ncbi:MAG: RluA family pseudouridine synthase [Alkalinema sp. RU_4_3]|nr:RluA family pseudouridine synthase [Alkalinema sp. RU_4_3]
MTLPYHYEGTCPTTGKLLRLPRSPQSEQIAQQLWKTLEADPTWPREGKMYGVLLTEDAHGNEQILKAFSGLINGEALLPDWVPPLPGRSTFANAEVSTLLSLETLKQELIQLQTLPIYQEYQTLQEACDIELAALDTVHLIRKQERDRQRKTNHDPQFRNDLQWQSRQDGSDRRQLKKQQKERLEPLRQQILIAESRIKAIKQERRQLSQQLQIQMHQAYQLTNFLGLSTSLRALMPQGAPTGTGECCAPKLLHHAAILGLRPIAMAEFWWGEAKGDRIPGTFYGACQTRCQPIMGFLLGGTQRRSIDLPILYEDEIMLAVDKPSGLLSVPGRGSDRMDCAWMRLKSHYSDIQPVHRLDQDTSGVLLFAKNLDMQRALRQCFEQRQVEKVYEAIVVGEVLQDMGSIDLPLWGDPTQRPRQIVDAARGKPALTKFRVSNRSDGRTRLVLHPVTGRTHQLRVHTAAGLNSPILGDHLYGLEDNQRLHLHARHLMVPHPITMEAVAIDSPVPF